MVLACTRSRSPEPRRDAATTRSEVRALLAEIAEPGGRPGGEAATDLPFGLLHALGVWRPADKVLSR